MKVINLYGGPGTGKSTTAAGLFFLMKSQGKKVELVVEYAKELAWEERHDAIQDQLFILAEQNKRLARLDGKVAFAITDSPLLLSHVYAQDEIYPSFHGLVDQVYGSYENVNVLLRRVKPFAPYGRFHTEEESQAIDREIEALLKRWSEDTGEPFYIFDADTEAPGKILEALD